MSEKQGGGWGRGRSGVFSLRTVLKVWPNRQPASPSPDTSRVVTRHAPLLLFSRTEPPVAPPRSVGSTRVLQEGLCSRGAMPPYARASLLTHTRTHAHLQCASTGGGSRAPALRARQESAGLAKSRVSDNFPLHQQGKETTNVPLYLGSSFNIIYAFCARNCGIFPHGKQYGNVKNRSLPARVHGRTPG